MGRKLISFTMSIIVMLLVVAFGIFGLIIYNEVGNTDFFTTPTANDIEDFQTTSFGKETVDKNIETPPIAQGSWEKINSNEKEINEVDYDNVQIATNKYFYEQLNEYSKTIYRALESNKENMKTGTYKIELGSNFSTLLKTEGGSTRLGEYYQSAIEAYIYDNAEIFYLSPNKMYLEMVSYSNGKYDVSIDNSNLSNYLTDEYQNGSQVNAAIQEVENVRNTLVSRKTGDDYNDIKMVHDYLIDTIEYDETISEPNIYDVYGALVRRKAVCEGYARAFKYIMDGMNIPCVMVIGKGTNSEGRVENHAWNYVSLNGKWYAVDATWDDPIIIGGGRLSEESKYRYFLKGANTMNQNHIPSGQFTESGMNFNYPELSTSDY